MTERELKLETALREIAAFGDKAAEKHLEITGSYTLFDEPGSVEIARQALSALSIPASQSGMGDEVERNLLGELQALAFELRKRDGNMLHPHYESELVSRAAARIKALSTLPRAVLTPEQAAERVILAARAIVNRHLEQKLPPTGTGKPWLEVIVRPNEMKELRSALEPFQNLNRATDGEGK